MRARLLRMVVNSNCKNNKNKNNTTKNSSNSSNNMNRLSARLRMADEYGTIYLAFVFARYLFNNFQFSCCLESVLFNSMACSSFAAI